MWRPGRRMFTIACILILMTAVLHTIGNLRPRSMGEAQNKVIDAMQSSRLPMGMGMEPSFYDILRTLTFTMSVTFVALGVTGLMLTASKSISSGVIRNVTWFYLIWNGAFTFLCYYYRVPPPLICGVMIELALIVALISSAKKGNEAAMSATA